MTRKHNVTAILYDKRGMPLSVGKNSYTKTHPLQQKIANKVGLPEKSFQHAELNCIVKCKDLTRAHKIVIMRYTKDGEPANAKPCAICGELIRLSGIKVVEYTTG